MDNNEQDDGYTQLAIKSATKKRLEEYRDSLKHNDTFTSAIESLLDLAHKHRHTNFEWYPSVETADRMQAIMKQYNITSHDELINKMVNELQARAEAEV